MHIWVLKGGMLQQTHGYSSPKRAAVLSKGKHVPAEVSICIEDLQERGRGLLAIDRDCHSILMDEGRNSNMDPKTAEQLGHFRESLEEGRTYEYSERIKSTSKRLAQRGKNADAMFLLLEGTRDLLIRGDFESTLGIVLQVLDIVGTNPQEAAGLTVYFADCYGKMPPVLREKFISRALKLCNTSQLYRAVAEVLEREENYISAAVSR